VSRNQRERLLGAMVAVVDAKGYEKASVADLIELSGVSRSSFYSLFRNKEECFLATFDALSDGMERSVAAALLTIPDAGPEARARLALQTLLDLLARYPAAAQLAFVEIFAAGRAGVDRRADRLDGYATLARRELEESPEHVDAPRALARAVIGGAHRVIHKRVCDDDTGTLPELTDELLEWGLGYHTPPGRIREPRVVLASSAGPRFSDHDAAGRIFAAMVPLVADHGYAAVTVEGICAAAGVSLHTFYGCFEDKEAAFVACQDATLAQAYALMLPAIDRAHDWAHGIRAGLHALLAFLAGDPKAACAAVVESVGARSRASGRITGVAATLSALLEPGRKHRSGLPASTVEATGGAVHALIFDQARNSGGGRLLALLPLCTYVALAPFVGAEKALAVANDGGRTRRGKRRPSLA
jgi:AcrR family transcriptional regulator